MKCLAFSDLHCNERKARKLVERSADVDVVLGVGDFASVHHGLEETMDALSAIEKPFLAVPGNNETDEALRAACGGWATVLHGEATEIEGVPFFGLGAGVPTTPWDWSFDLTEQEAESMLAACPEGAVLLSHSPPEGPLGQGAGQRCRAEGGGGAQTAHSPVRPHPRALGSGIRCGSHSRCAISAPRAPWWKLCISTVCTESCNLQDFRPL